MDVVEKKEIIHEMDQYPHDCDYYGYRRGYGRGWGYGDWDHNRYASKGVGGAFCAC